MPKKCGGKAGGEGGSGAQKRGPAPSPPDAVGANKKTSTPSTSDRSTKTKTTNVNLAQGTKVEALRTATSYFDKGWNAFAQQKDGSMQLIPEQIVGIGEDFHSQVDDDKVKTTLYKVRWSRCCGTPCERLQFPNIPAGVVAHHARGCSFRILFGRTEGCNLAHGL